MTRRPALLAAVSAIFFAIFSALVALVGAAPARADSPHLAEARRAVEAVDYDAARRLLVEALADGDNSPAAVGEIYRLSARTAVVLDQRDLAEQYYRRWLAIDPAAALPDDTAPKLREPFVAAAAYVAAHGPLRARAQRTAAGDIDVELLADPLAMARAAAAFEPPPPRGATAHATVSPSAAPAARPGPPVAFGADHHAHLPAASGRVAILDDRGNRLVELDPEPAGLAAPAAPAPTASDLPWNQRWQTWAIPAGVLGLTAGAFGIAAITSYQNAQRITDDSGSHFLSEAEAEVRRGKIFVWVTIATGAAAVALAIPAAVYYARDHDLRQLVASPLVGGGSVGVALSGRF